MAVRSAPQASVNTCNYTSYAQTKGYAPIMAYAPTTVYTPITVYAPIMVSAPITVFAPTRAYALAPNRACPSRSPMALYPVEAAIKPETRRMSTLNQ